MTERRTSMFFGHGFASIAPSIYEVKPSRPYNLSRSTIPPSSEPLLIVLCTWTGAQHRHIAKYTLQYQNLFPHTPILIITTSAKDLCFRSSQLKQKRLQPAILRILSLTHPNTPRKNNGILLHVLSEGGSNKACELASAYLSFTRTRLPLAALYLDSTPGHPRYLRLCSALNKSLPPIPVVRHTSLIFGGALVAALDELLLRARLRE